MIFDLDGTLLNTIGDLAAAANHTLAEMGFAPHTEEEYKYMVGNGIPKPVSYTHLFLHYARHYCSKVLRESKQGTGDFYGEPRPFLQKNPTFTPPCASFYTDFTPRI